MMAFVLNERGMQRTRDKVPTLHDVLLTREQVELANLIVVCIGTKMWVLKDRFSLVPKGTTPHINQLGTIMHQLSEVVSMTSVVGT